MYADFCVQVVCSFSGREGTVDEKRTKKQNRGKAPPKPMLFAVPLPLDRLPEWKRDEMYLQAVEAMKPGQEVTQLRDPVWVTGTWDGVSNLRSFLLRMQRDLGFSDDEMRETRSGPLDLAEYMPDTAKWPRFFGGPGGATWP
jgi:hypothetical protein